MATVANPLFSCNVRVRYCRFHDAAGYAVRDGQRRCFYIDHDAHFTLLTDADSAHLVLLGAVELVEQQHLLDALHGGVAKIACSRL
jgi:hypothetical protein